MATVHPDLNVPHLYATLLLTLHLVERQNDTLANTPIYRQNLKRLSKGLADEITKNATPDLEAIWEADTPTMYKIMDSIRNVAETLSKLKSAEMYVEVDQMLQQYLALQEKLDIVADEKWKKRALAAEELIDKVKPLVKGGTTLKAMLRWEEARQAMDS